MGEFVDSAGYACRNRGCQMAAVGPTLKASAAALEELTGRKKMSQALWCDQAGHAFSERDPGRQRISVTVLDADGAEKQEARDLCGDCAASSGLLAPRVTRPQLAASPVTVPAPPAPPPAAQAEYSFEAPSYAPYADHSAAPGGRQ